MGNRDNSRTEWQQEIVERQHNLTPAEITRTSQFRGSGLPRSAPLPIAIRWAYIYVGGPTLALGIGIRIVFANFYLPVVGTAVAAAGLLIMLSGVKWRAK